MSNKMNIEINPATTVLGAGAGGLLGLGINRYLLGNKTATSNIISGLLGAGLGGGLGLLGGLSAPNMSIKDAIALRKKYGHTLVHHLNPEMADKAAQVDSDLTGTDIAQYAIEGGSGAVGGATLGRVIGMGVERSKGVKKPHDVVTKSGKTIKVDSPAPGKNSAASLGNLTKKIWGGIWDEVPKFSDANLNRLTRADLEDLYDAATSGKMRVKLSDAQLAQMRKMNIQRDLNNIPMGHTKYRRIGGRIGGFLGAIPGIWHAGHDIYERYKYL